MSATSCPRSRACQAEPKIELKKDMRSDEDTILKSYGWLDPKQGSRFRIPIDCRDRHCGGQGVWPPNRVRRGSDNDGYRMIPEDSSSGRTLEKISQ